MGMKYRLESRVTLQRKGLGARLMRSLMSSARAAGIRVMHGDVLAGNQRMLQFTARLGFHSRLAEDDPRLMRVEIDL